MIKLEQLALRRAFVESDPVQVTPRCEGARPKLTTYLVFPRGTLDLVDVGVYTRASDDRF